MRKIFIAEFEYGKGKIAKATLIKETNKFYMVNDIEYLDGWMYVSGRQSKQNCFFSHKEAIEFVLSEAEKNYQRKLENANEAHHEVVLWRALSTK